MQGDDLLIICSVHHLVPRSRRWRSHITVWRSGVRESPNWDHGSCQQERSTRRRRLLNGDGVVASDAIKSESEDSLQVVEDPCQTLFLNGIHLKLKTRRSKNFKDLRSSPYHEHWLQCLRQTIHFLRSHWFSLSPRILCVCLIIVLRMVGGTIHTLNQNEP
jgi:hypothetical protein